MASRPLLSPEKYTVAWIAPLEIEAQAALNVLDSKHTGRFPIGRGDDYVFRAGEIFGHNVIIATLPAGQAYGTGSAAALASQVKKFFPNLWFGLLVGVAAGLPNLSRHPPRDIRLGDVLVGLPDGDGAGLVAYELGRATETEQVELLRHGHVLAQTEPIVRSAIGSLKLDSPHEIRTFMPYYKKMEEMEHTNGTFEYPGQANDIFHEVSDDGSDIAVVREQRPEAKRTRVWYGSIGSGDKLMRNATTRDKLRDKFDLIGLEMEAAGTMNCIPVGVIRGVCDYGDKHKNKIWQPYAAAMAAAYAKAVLEQIPAGDAPARGENRDSDMRRRRRSDGSDEDDSRQKRRGFGRKNHGDSGGGNSLIFNGQGIQNMGGSISIGGGQHITNNKSS